MKFVSQRSTETVGFSPAHLVSSPGNVEGVDCDNPQAEKDAVIAGLHYQSFFDHYRNFAYISSKI